jgi:Leucine-rich repeat (LRR) protein
LGDELPNLRTLSLCGCGLFDLDGVTNAANLVTLVAADNDISDVLPVTELRKISTVDLQK